MNNLRALPLGGLEYQNNGILCLRTKEVSVKSLVSKKEGEKMAGSGKNSVYVGVRGFAAVFAAILFAFIFVNITAMAGAAEVIKLKYSTSFFPPEPPCVFANRTLDLVEKKTNGKVKIERFVGGALGGPLEQLGLASSGAADLISLHIDQYAQQLPLHQITNTEQLTSGAQGVDNVKAILHELPETKPLFDAEQRKNNIKILHPYCNGPTGVTARFPAESLADVKGKKVNVIAAYQRDVFKELGWIPVNVQIPELYEAGARGIIEMPINKIIE